MTPDILYTGDILICHSDRLLSRIIRWFTKSEFNHAAVYINIDGYHFIADAQADGVNLRPFDVWRDKYQYKWIAFRDSMPETDSWYRIRALKKVGNTAYDFESLIFKHPIKLLTGKWKKESNSVDQMFCSEFAAYVHQIDSAFKLSPEDLYQQLDRLGYIAVQSSGKWKWI